MICLKTNGVPNKPEGLTIAIWNCYSQTLFCLSSLLRDSIIHDKCSLANAIEMQLKFMPSCKSVFVFTIIIIIIIIIGIFNLEDSQSQKSRATTRAISTIVKKQL